LGIGRFELAAVNRQQPSAKELQLLSRQDELVKPLPECHAVVSAEISKGFDSPVAGAGR
jgi:hypothetical protein